MGTTFQASDGGDAHGIGVFGTTADHPIEELEIVDNDLANLTLGSSEALVVNGNVKDFLIEGNRVHDTNNIGIDVIGIEGSAPDPRPSTRRATASCEEHGVEYRQLQEPRLRRGSQRRQDLRGRRPRRRGRGT